MPCSAANASIEAYLARFSSDRFWMSWSSTNTGCRSSATRRAPIEVNFCITAAVLSWVST